MVVMMSLAVALALIAFVSPISAVPVGTHDITFVGKTSDGAGNSIWTYNVTTGCSPSLSHWSLGFCGEEADILEVSEAWEYHTDTYDSVDITGVKFEEGYECDDEDGPEIRTVWFKLEGDWPEGSVEVGTKAGSDKPGKVATALGSVTGPVCNVGEPIPEFATITIPIVALLGLLAFYRRKQKK